MHKTDFPIFKNNPSLVYLDNSATTQKPQVVIDSIVEFYENYNSNVHRGIHRLAERATAAYEHARENIADFIGAKPEEIIFTSGTTESINLITLMLANFFQEDSSGKTILLSEMEHHSNILPWIQLAKRLNWNVEYVKVNSGYELDIVDLNDKIEENNVSIISLTHMSNVLGTINNLDEIFKLVKTISPDTICVADGAQFIPHHRINLSKSVNIDFYSFSGHKMMGPTGIGVLFGRKSLLKLLQPVKVGGGMIAKVEKVSYTTADIPEKFEAGTPNISGAIGLSAAIDYLEQLNSKEIENQMKQLINYTYYELTQLEELTLFGTDNLENKGPVFSFDIQGVHPHDIAQLLDQDNIAVRAGHHCCQILHREIINKPATARASLYLYNDIEEINKLITSIKKIISQFKQ